MREYYLINHIGLSERSIPNVNKISSKDFLDWAKTDLKGSDRRSRGNGIGNIKKVIHSRMDEIIAKTHLKYTNNWNPILLNTDGKLKILKKLDIKYTSIAGLITDIRNKYEHSYIIPSLQEIRAQYDTTELWLNDSYNSYDFNPIGLSNLPMMGIGLTSTRPNNLSYVNMVNFKGNESVLYFWNSKKVIMTVKKDGSITKKNYSDYTWEEMLLLEAPIIKKINKASSTTNLNQISMTDVYKKYLKWKANY